nr:MAG TPA: hypothetical protein [Bacteriophage sp.]
MMDVYNHIFLNLFLLTSSSPLLTITRKKHHTYVNMSISNNLSLFVYLFQISNTLNCNTFYSLC